MSCFQQNSTATVLLLSNAKLCSLEMASQGHTGKALVGAQLLLTAGDLTRLGVVIDFIPAQS